MAGRVAYRLTDGPIRTAAAARLYAPLGGKGVEGAVGLDWAIAKGVRLSAERRIGLDRAGRDAWSVYAAGGIYRDPRPGIVIDSYAQAGLVGAARRDLFVDGAVRAGKRIAIGQSSLIVGAGVWGAAQPGVSRLDAGPRVGASLPVAKGSVSMALEGRFRIAGRARPGSGAALTIGFDL